MIIKNNNFIKFSNIDYYSFFSLRNFLKFYIYRFINYEDWKNEERGFLKLIYFSLSVYFIKFLIY